MTCHLPAVLIALTLALTASSGAQGPGGQVGSPQVKPPATEIAAALQQKYDSIKDFTASFTQTEERGALRRRTTESGTVAVKKPGKMRWEYMKPQRKLFVSDGRMLYMYFPDDKQVIRNPVEQQDDAASAILFLMGRGNVTRDFNVRYGDGGNEDVYVLRLDPKKRQAEYDWLEIAADRETLQIRTLTAGDVQGGRSTFAFTNFKENTGLPDKMFQFEIPKGTEVISGRTP